MSTPRDEALLHAKFFNLDLDTITKESVEEALAKKLLDQNALEEKVDVDKKTKAIKNAAAALQAYIVSRKANSDQEEAKHEVTLGTTPLQPKTKTKHNTEVVYEVTLEDPKDSKIILEFYTSYVTGLKEKTKQANSLFPQKTTDLVDYITSNYKPIKKTLPASTAADGTKTEARTVIVLRFKSEKDALAFIDQLQKKIKIKLSYKITSMPTEEQAPAPGFRKG